VRILLDENMPGRLLAALVAEGQEVDSVKSLQLQGIDNEALYQLAASNYDLCFTRDAEFSKRIQQMKSGARLKLVHVIIPKPVKTNSCSNSSSRFGKQIGQTMTVAMIGRRVE
jgi:predicted nuclease of predicted toxin-antitoxin system